MKKFRTEKKIVDINLIVPNKWNPNFQTKQMFAKGKQAVEQLGMLGSILVRDLAGHYEILDGEHRWKYLKELGYTECPVETIGEIADGEAKLLTVLMNNIKGSDDLEKRAKIFEQLQEGQLQLLPFTHEEIENEKSLFKFDFSQYDKVENIDTSKNTLIQIVVPLEIKTLWLKCIAIAKENHKTDLQLIVEMMEDYIALNKGSAPGQREQFL